MSKYDTAIVCITTHAHQQYCSRVEPIGHGDLRRLCQQQVIDREMTYDAKGWFHLAGVWWVYEQHDQEMIFVTCYGKSTIDMPRAIGWATRFHDRINLDGGVPDARTSP